MLSEKDRDRTSCLTDAVTSDYYATTARRGHTLTAEHYERTARLLQARIGSWLPIDFNSTILELACGNGELLYSLEKTGYKHLTGVDLCLEELDMARQYTRATLLHQDIEVLLKNTADRSVDCVIGLNIIEHLQKDKAIAVLSHCHRVLKAGGCAVLMVPNALSPFGCSTRYWDITHELAFTPNNFHQLAALLGYSDVNVKECGPVVHGLVSGIRYGLWRIIRRAIMLYQLVEVGSTRSDVWTMDMLIRLTKAS